MFTRLSLFALLICAISFSTLSQAGVSLGGQGGGGDAIGSLPYNNLIFNAGGSGSGGDTIGSLPNNHTLAMNAPTVAIIYKVEVTCATTCNASTMTSADWAQLRTAVAAAAQGYLSGAAFNQAFEAALNRGLIHFQNGGSSATVYLSSDAGNQAEASAVGSDDETVGTLP